MQATNYATKLRIMKTAKWIRYTEEEDLDFDNFVWDQLSK